MKKIFVTIFMFLLFISSYSIINGTYGNYDTYKICEEKLIDNISKSKYKIDDNKKDKIEKLIPLLKDKYGNNKLVELNKKIIKNFNNIENIEDKIFYIYLIFSINNQLDIEENTTELIEDTFCYSSIKKIDKNIIKNNIVTDSEIELVLNNNSVIDSEITTVGNYSLKSNKKEKTEYPMSYDISDSFKYKRIQQKSLSCESSATSDIISKRLGKNITEDDIIEILPKSEYGKTAWFEDDNRIWGDPNKGFVGIIDKIPISNLKALQRKYQGYGVYEKPISEVYDLYNIKNTIINKENRYYLNLNSQEEHLVYLLKEFYNGADIQLWGDRCTYPEYEDGIKEVKYKLTQKDLEKGINGKNKCIYPFKDRILTWYIKEDDGSLKEHKGLNGQHAFYLLGYKGSIIDPTHIIIWDTNTGKHTYETKEWLRKWSKMDDRSIVIH